jgi:hypothetical protein
MMCTAPPGFKEIDTGMEGPDVLVFTVGSDEFLEEFTNAVKALQDRGGVMRIQPDFRYPTLEEARHAAAGAFGPHPRGQSSRRHADGTWEPL